LYDILFSLNLFTVKDEINPSQHRAHLQWVYRFAQAKSEKKTALGKANIQKLRLQI